MGIPQSDLADYQGAIDIAVGRMREWVKASSLTRLPNSVWHLPKDCPLWAAGLSFAQAQAVFSVMSRELAVDGPAIEDMNGKAMRAGDRVLVPCVVYRTWPVAEQGPQPRFNLDLMVETDLPFGCGQFLTVHGSQVQKCDPENAEGKDARAGLLGVGSEQA